MCARTRPDVCHSSDITKELYCTWMEGLVINYCLMTHQIILYGMYSMVGAFYMYVVYKLGIDVVLDAMNFVTATKWNLFVYRESGGQGTVISFF